MDWVSDVDWQAVGTIVAMAGVIASFWLTMRGQKQDRELAGASASRAEAAAQLTESYTARVVEALEAIAATGLGQAPPPAPHARWELAHHQGDRYILENVGNATAYDTQVTAHESMRGPVDLQGDRDVPPDGALTFIATRTLGTTDSTITVTWKPCPDTTDDEREIWKYPLPAKPPR